MSNTPLFHELHSALFHSLVGVINEIHAGAKLTRKDVLRRLQPLDPVDTSRHEEIIKTMFSFSPNGEAELFLEKPVRLPPTRAEMRGAHAMRARPRRAASNTTPRRTAAAPSSGSWTRDEPSR